MGFDKQMLKHNYIDDTQNTVKAIESHLSWQHVSCFVETLQISIKAGLGLSCVTVWMAACRTLAGYFKHSNKAKAALEDMPMKFGFLVTNCCRALLHLETLQMARIAE